MFVPIAFLHIRVNNYSVQKYPCIYRRLVHKYVCVRTCREFFSISIIWYKILICFMFYNCVDVFFLSKPPTADYFVCVVCATCCRGKHTSSRLYRCAYNVYAVDVLPQTVQNRMKNFSPFCERLEKIVFTTTFVVTS